MNHYHYSQFMKFPSSRQRGCYIRTITAGVQLKKINLGVGLKGLDAKTN
jgi:hypothetical protein